MSEKKSFFLRNIVMLVVIFLLILASIVNATTIKLGNDGSDTYFTIPVSATKAEVGSLYADGDALMLYSDGSFNVISNISGEAVSFLTVDTGQGANELYDMDQNVLTSSEVSFSKVTSVFHGDGGNLTNVSAAHNYFNQDLNTTSIVTFSSIAGDGGNLTNVSGGADGYFVDGKIHTSAGTNYTATSSNIQSAIDDFDGTGGGTVWIPAGVYTITSTLLIDEPSIEIIGQSMGETNTATTGTVLKMGASLSDGVIHVYNSSNWPDNIAIKNIEIDGNSRGYKGIGINLDHTGWIQMENLHIRNIDGYAIKYDAVHGSILKDSYIEGCGNVSEKKPAVWITGTFLGWDDKTTTPVFDNVIFHPGMYGWVHVQTDANLSQVHGKIVNCYFEGNTSIEYGVISGYNWIIDGNTFIEHCNNAYLRLNSSVCGHTVISNNIFTYGCDNDAGNDAQISLSGVGQVTIVGNEFWASNHYALYISSSCSDIILSNNIITGDEIGVIASADDCIFSGNKVYDVTTGTGVGFYLSGVDNSTIVGNNFENCDIGILLSSLWNNTIVGNTFKGCSDAELSFSGSNNHNNIISNNIGYNFNSLFPYYAQNSAPTLNDNTTVWWYDTDDNYFYIVAKTYGTQYYVNMTTSI